MTELRIQPPVADRRPTIRTHHGDDFQDHYEWLRQKDDAQVIAHLEAENSYTEARTAHLEPLRERVFQEIKGRVQETDLSVPTRDGDWWYYGRTVEGAQYGIQCRTAVADPDDWTPPTLEPGVAVAGEQILLDGNAEATGHDFFSLGAFDVSDDGTRMLWATDLEGSEVYTLHARRLDTGENFDDVIENISQAFFTPDGSAIIYTTRDEAWRPDTLWLHRLGTAVDEDVQLFHEADDRYWLGAGITRSKKYLIAELGSKITSETHLFDLADLTAPAQVVWPRRDGVEYDVDHAVVNGEDVLYVLHNDGALDFELVTVSASEPQGERRVVLAHTPGRRILDVDCFRDFATVEYRREGLSRSALLSYSDDRLDELEFDEPLFSAWFAGNAQWHSPLLRMTYVSYVTPRTVIDLDVATGERIVRKQQTVLGDYDAKEYGQQRVWARADDGTAVPVSLIWKHSFGAPGDAVRAVYLYGYGSYEHSLDPGFSVSMLSMLDRGAVIAMAHVRGGGEMGRHWYEQGKELSKRNTFTDFIACARHLIDAGITAPDRMVASGGSAGGLLMGAVANLAPELFAGILAEVPFVDALTTILDPSLPLTVIEWDEWGDPLHDADVYAYMKSYSPYENIRTDAEYPPILAITSLNDTRVLYVEPAKWVAALRCAGASDVLLKCEMVAGHGGVSGRYNAWREGAFAMAWSLERMGLAE